MCFACVNSTETVRILDLHSWKGEAWQPCEMKNTELVFFDCSGTETHIIRTLPHNSWGTVHPPMTPPIRFCRWVKIGCGILRYLQHEPQHTVSTRLYSLKPSHIQINAELGLTHRPQIDENFELGRQCCDNYDKSSTSRISSKNGYALPFKFGSRRYTREHDTTKKSIHERRALLVGDVWE